MNRTELIAATAAVLFVAFVLGWFVSWLMHRFTRIAQADLGEVDHLAQSVHEAEEARDAAVAQMHDKERELLGRLAQTEAELRAAMEVLRDTRSEVEGLRETLSAADPEPELEDDPEVEAEPEEKGEAEAPEESSKEDGSSDDEPKDEMSKKDKKKST